MNKIEKIQQILSESVAIKNAICQDESLLATLDTIIHHIVVCFQNKNKLLLCGNGGSAADAQHLAAEFSGRFYLQRVPLFAEALHVNSSYLTAVANDFGFEHTYSRMVEAAGREGDILWAFSTSGNSPNIIQAAKKAQNLKMKVIGFTGSKTSLLKEHCDILIQVPSENTPRIQEAHITLGHIICELVEAQLFS